PYITGYLKNLTGSFTLGWIYLAGSLIVSGLLMLTMRRDVDLERS
ncbi:MAG TPA: MFS transporter, partial [Verrucomicrobiales bacterium]|nr:MFS transporter [Verrucomicrobiales bacterium]